MLKDKYTINVLNDRMNVNVLCFYPFSLFLTLLITIIATGVDSFDDLGNFFWVVKFFFLSYRFTECKCIVFNFFHFHYL